MKISSASGCNARCRRVNDRKSALQFCKAGCLSWHQTFLKPRSKSITPNWSYFPGLENHHQPRSRTLYSSYKLFYHRCRQTQIASNYFPCSLTPRLALISLMLRSFSSIMSLSIPEVSSLDSPGRGKERTTQAGTPATSVYGGTFWAESQQKTNMPTRMVYGANLQLTLVTTEPAATEEPFPMMR